MSCARSSEEERKRRLALGAYEVPATGLLTLSQVQHQRRLRQQEDRQEQVDRGGEQAPQRRLVRGGELDAARSSIARAGRPDGDGGGRLPGHRDGYGFADRTGGRVRRYGPV